MPCGHPVNIAVIPSMYSKWLCKQRICNA